MEANRVVLYFEKHEDALLFTLAASSAMSTEASIPDCDAERKLAAEVSKVTRVTVEGFLDLC